MTAYWGKQIIVENIWLHRVTGSFTLIFRLEQNRKISFDEFKEMVISDAPQSKPAE